MSLPVGLRDGSVSRALRCILQVSTADLGGGAEGVAWNLFRSFRARGYAGSLAVGRKYSDDPDVVPIPNAGSRGSWFRFWQAVHGRLESLDGQVRGLWRVRQWARTLAEPGRWLDDRRGIETFRFPGTRYLMELPGRRPDVVHCHNLHGDYFDLRQLSRLSHSVPVVLTLHDAWLLSGHCAHSFDCRRWQVGCGRCPDLTIDPAIRRDATAKNWRRKQQTYARSRLYVAAPSRWLLEKVDQSMLASGIVETRLIPYGVDLSVFVPAEKRLARAALEMPIEATILLFSAKGIRNNIWKDYQTMRTAVARVADRLGDSDLIFIALGEDGPTERIGRAEVRFVPFQKTPNDVARYYQAADVYLHAARADTFPNVVLEALACGTPVVATAVGGIPEQIDDGSTGYLTRPQDAQDMADAIIRLLNDPASCRAMGENAVQQARMRFDLNRQVDDYLDWYERILESNGA